jgi:hypothetical protein
MVTLAETRKEEPGRDGLGTVKMIAYNQEFPSRRTPNTRGTESAQSKPTR